MSSSTNRQILLNNRPVGNPNYQNQEQAKFSAAVSRKWHGYPDRYND